MIRGEDLELADIEFMKIKANMVEYLTQGVLRKILRKYIKVMTFDQDGVFGKSKKYKNDILFSYPCLTKQKFKNWHHYLVPDTKKPL